MFILVETFAALDPVSLPPEVGIVGEAGPWPVHALSSLPSANAVPEGDAFQAKLLALLQQEGKSMGDVKAVVMGTQPPAPVASTDLVNAISKLVDRCNQASTDAPSYRKLRLFSGLRPVPPGEEEYDVWMEQATQMITEWGCADAAKRQRIVESLRGPAADIVRFLKVSGPSATATEYLAALDTVYGSTESGADLMALFRHTFQENGEKLSAYLCRLDKLLHRALVRGGMEPASLNHARLEQFFKGVLTTDLVALRVRMMHSLHNPPTFSQLMREIREEEHWASARENAKVSVSSAVVPRSSVTAAVAVPQVAVTPVLSEVDSLRNEVKELTVLVTRVLSATSLTPSTPATQTVVGQSQETIVSPRIVSSTLPASAASPSVLGIFCYKCGEDGHTKRECTRSENLRLVNQKLIKKSRPQGNFYGAHKASPSPLPAGLVGPSTEVPVQIEGIYAKALLDSGSQVTILYRSFYNAYLKHLPLQPVEHLEIWGLSAHKYPYDGYLSLRLEFTGAVTGVSQVVDALALVCPDPQTQQGIVILVGTNTHVVRKLFDSCREQAGDRFLSTLRIHPVFKRVFESLKPTGVAQDDVDKHGTVWYIKPKPVLKPGQEIQLSGLPKFPGKFSETLVLVEQGVASSDAVKVRYHSLSPGDRVLIRNLGFKGKHKLADRWGSCPYVVDGQLADLPVYRLKPVDDGPIKVMHRNHILPLGHTAKTGVLNQLPQSQF
ncbi:Paraneoplastic antigen Ma1 [Merluccius polli]|uniref:Paraneoplastic antigen Ma1 n=1 Tax=Merluccius polli TaxID=89951 RepID=A0AA47M4D9_MERPO|nr:Paraneoplastic antigen Ma1 [Merluccius polli]